jgi:hypothetical protein
MRDASQRTCLEIKFVFHTRGPAHWKSSSLLGSELGTGRLGTGATACCAARFAEFWVPRQLAAVAVALPAREDAGLHVSCTTSSWAEQLEHAAAVGWAFHTAMQPRSKSF